MKRPAFQFYPGDWQSNSNLRRCSHEEKGIWIDVMCLLHDQEEYGVARWPLNEIARAVGTTTSKLKALVAKGVLKGADTDQRCEPWIFTPTGAGRKKKDPVTLIESQNGPIWYSSRMVEDEYKRVIRGEYGESPKTALDCAPMGAIGATPKTTPDYAPSRAGASSSSSSSSKPKPPNPPEGGVDVPEPKARRRATTEVLQTFLERCKAAGERAISDYRPVWDYAERAGIPRDFVELCWLLFRSRYGAGGARETKRYADWRKTFRNAIEDNWFRLWSFDQGGQCVLTSQGRQAESSLREAA